MSFHFFYIFTHFEKINIWKGNLDLKSFRKNNFSAEEFYILGYNVV
jgi:hypothetical protein